MADTTAASTGTAPSESPAQAKARLRRERLAAKSGASRLQQITALQGGPPRSISDLEKDVPAKPIPTTSQPAPIAAGTATSDPDESDISQHHFQPASQPRLSSPFAFDGSQPGPFPLGDGSSQSQDPMMAMLQQMMGSGAEGPSGAPPNLPSGLSNIFTAMQGESLSEPPPDQSSAWIWRLVHSLLSVSLAIYIVLQTPFSGSKISRHAVLDDDWAQQAPTHNPTYFFYLFATFEVVLQTSRYFIEKGQLQGTGILNTIAGMLPHPYGNYVRTIGRYNVIWRTVVSDAMVIVFILGVTSWWKGAAVA